MNRWQKAQINERYFWKNRREQKPLPRPEYKDYINFMKKYLLIDKNTKILEIGCGPQTLVEEMEGKLYGLDPLMDYFLSTYSMNKNVEWKQGTGESIPYGSNFFNLIIIGNVLDHCANPTKVLQESIRCLAPGGYLFLVQNCYSSPLVIFKNFMEKIGLGDVCHPYAYSIPDIKDEISRVGFKMVADRGNFKLGISPERESLLNKIKRILKDKGIIYVLKHSVIEFLNYIPEKLFKTYSLYIFLAKKE